MLLFKFEEEDRLIQRLAVQAAGIMQSSGNLKKTANTESVMESIYAPLITHEETADVPERKVITDQEEARMAVEKIKAKINKQ